MRSIFIVVSALAIFAISSGAVIDGDNSNGFHMKHGINKFSMKLFQTLSDDVSGNIVFSPLSVYLGLSLLSSGAKGETLNEFLKVLNINHDEVYSRLGYKQLLAGINSISKTEFKIANILFKSENFTLHPEFLQKAKDIFEVDVQSVQFTDATKAAAIINKWAAGETHGLIKHLIESGDIDPDTLMMLLNAIYFKGKWAEPFDPEETLEDTFYVNETHVTSIQMMLKNGKFVSGNIPELESTFIQIPYENDEFQLLIILPETVRGIRKVEQNLDNIDIEHLIQSGKVKEFNIFLPKFKVESKYSLDVILQKMGLSDIFSTHADFSELSKIPVLVDSVMQKAFLEVNEEGSEGAAVSEFDFLSRNAGPPVFLVNKPALLIIHTKGVPVFITRLTDPVY